MRFIVSILTIAVLTPFAGALADSTKPPVCHIENNVSIQGWEVEYRICDGYYGFTHTETALRNLDTGTEYAK